MSWLKTWYPDYRAPTRGGRACPVPFHPRPASRAESHEGHALARHIPPSLPAPTPTAANSSRKHILR